ncbi:MAG: nitrilase-related carbon-nitrogen hydrolase [Planctomycetota bacterium]|jgi:predicted amidohydrolase
MTQIRIAAYPFDVRPGEVEHNLRCVLEALEMAVGAGAELLVLPEKWTTSFLESYPAEMRKGSEQALREVHDAARKSGLTVIGSAPGGEGEKPTNELHLLGACGSQRPYRKRMLFSPTGEGRQVERGDGLPVAVETPVGRIVGVVCYDLRFPEICRSAMYEQADLFVCVAQWPWPRVPVFELMSRARAVENQVWTISCNRAGEASLGGKGDVMRFPGMALLVDPLGEVSARVDDGGLLVGDVDPGMAAKVRRHVPLARDLERAGLWKRD